MAHRIPNPSWSELFEALVDLELKKLNSGQEKITAAAAKRRVKSAAENSRYIPQSLRQRIWERDGGQCQFIDPLTKRRCESSYALQVDHIMPYAFGGKASEENLRLLCRAHNAFCTEEVFGSTSPLIELR